MKLGFDNAIAGECVVSESTKGLGCLSVTGAEGVNKSSWQHRKTELPLKQWDKDVVLQAIALPCSAVECQRAAHERGQNGWEAHLHFRCGNSQEELQALLFVMGAEFGEEAHHGSISHERWQVIMVTCLG